MEVQKAILLDRSWVTKFAFEWRDIPDSIYKILDETNSVLVESAGASAFERRLMDNKYLNRKIYLVRSTDIPQLSEDDKQSVYSSFTQASQSESVVSAIRAYRTASGRMSDEDSSLLGYIFRLLMISETMQSELLVWESRYRILRAVLSSMNVPFHEEVNGRVVSLRTETSCFPFGHRMIGKGRGVLVLTIMEAGNEGAGEAIHGHNDSRPQAEIPAITIGLGGPSLDIVAWLRYLRGKMGKRKPIA